MSDEYTLCIKCGNELTDPRSLDCSHSFCFTCLQHYVCGLEHKEKITCLKSNCNVETLIPAGGVDEMKCHPLVSMFISQKAQVISQAAQLVSQEAQLLSREAQLKSALQASNNPTEGEYHNSLAEMKRNGVAILLEETSLLEFKKETNASLLYALFFRENGNTVEFSKVSRLFCTLAQLFNSNVAEGGTDKNVKDVIRYVAVDMDKCSSQSVDDKISENDIILWKPSEYNTINRWQIEYLGSLPNVAFMRYNPTVLPTYIERTPLVRANITMCCPIHGCSDPKTKWDWYCVACLSGLEYDIDNDKIFCDCGLWENTDRPTSYDARCGNASHGLTTVAHSQLRSTLQKLERVKEINVLVLGETGVGKSTWINSIANYITSFTLDEAKCDGKFQCLIESVLERHSASNKCDPQDEDIKIEITKKAEDPNVQWNTDTVKPASYLIHTKKQNVRLIDTPGLGNPAGRELDQQHCEDILYFLSNSQFQEIHGICILLKSGTTRLTDDFKYCLTELFKQLHTSAAKNLIFCFTFSRLYHYSSKIHKGINVLRKIISDIEKDIKADIFVEESRNVFFLDNEVFEYLCLVRNNVEFDEAETVDNKRSWNHSRAETERLFQYIESLNPYSIRNSTSIYQARILISQIIEPILAFQKMMESNNRSMEIASAGYEMDSAIKVSNNMYFKMEKKIIKELNSTSSQCRICFEEKVVNPTAEKHQQQVHSFEKICEENTKWYQRAWWRIFARECPSCKHSSRYHKYSAVRQISVSYYECVVSVQRLKDEIDANKKILSRITEIMIQFSIFLQKSALVKYSDIVVDKIRTAKHMFKERKITNIYSKKDRDGDIDTLRSIKKNYLEEKEKCKSQPVLQVEQIFELREELYAIPLIGVELKRLIDIEETSRNKEMSRYEIFVSRVSQVVHTCIHWPTKSGEVIEEGEEVHAD